MFSLFSVSSQLPSNEPCTIPGECLWETHLSPKMYIASLLYPGNHLFLFFFFFAPTVPIQTSTTAHRTYFFHFSLVSLLQFGIMSNSAYLPSTDPGAEDIQERMLLEAGMSSTRGPLVNAPSSLHKNSLCSRVDLICGFRFTLINSQKTYGYGQMPLYSIQEEKLEI